VTCASWPERARRLENNPLHNAGDWVLTGAAAAVPSLRRNIFLL
jgi:hypothetical protein